MNIVLLFRSQNDKGCSRYPDFMARYCPMTCGICSLPPPLVSSTKPTTAPKPVTSSQCVDFDWRCPSWAAFQNQCATNRQFMSKLVSPTFHIFIFIGIGQLQWNVLAIPIGSRPKSWWKNQVPGSYMVIWSHIFTISICLSKNLQIQQWNIITVVLRYL